MKKIKTPVLAIMGGADNHTAVELHFEPLYKALQKAENRNYKIVVLADEDHFFLRYQGKRMEKHKFEEMEVSHRFIETMTSWLKQQGITHDN